MFDWRMCFEVDLEYSFSQREMASQDSGARPVKRKNLS